MGICDAYKEAKPLCLKELAPLEVHVLGKGLLLQVEGPLPLYIL